MTTISFTWKRFLIILFFSCELIEPFLSIIVGGHWAEWLCNAMIMVVFVFTLCTNVKCIKLLPFLILFLSLMAFGISYLLHPEYSSVMFSEYNIWKNVFDVRKGLFFMIILSLENEPEELLKSLKISCLPLWIVYTIRVIYGMGLSKTTGGNHAYGYVFLFVTLIYGIYYFRERKWFDLLMAAISFMEVIMVASRMTMVSFIVFWILYMLLYETDREKLGKKILLLIMGGIASLLIMSKPFLDMLQNILNEFGLHSKILTGIITGNNNLDGGRKYMYEHSHALLLSNPSGLGVYWDRYVYKRFNYAHNVFYEIMIDFGWVIGGLLILILGINIYKILRSNEKEWKLLFILFFSLSMIRLLLSYSFWIDTNFWGMIAILINYRYSKKSGERLCVKD